MPRRTASCSRTAARPSRASQIFKDHGYNWVRLRLFHTPTRLPNNLEYTIAQAQAAKKLGFKFLLNYHYSDTWADPQKQFMPKAWEGMSHDELVEAVFDYTRDTVAAFREAGVMPDMVQTGNEVIGGMLWPDGRLPQNWEQFRRAGEGRHPRRRRRPGRRTAAADHDAHRSRRRIPATK